MPRRQTRHRRRSSVCRSRKRTIRKQKGGNPERVQQLADIVKQLLYFIVYKKYAWYKDLGVFEAIPEDKQKSDINGPLAGIVEVQKKVRDIGLDEYMKNTHYSLEELVNRINRMDQRRRHCFQRFPPNMHTPEYLTELDETLSEFVYNEDSLDTVIGIINNYLFLNEIDDLIPQLADFFFETIEPQINRLYGHPIYNPETDEYE